MRLLIIFIFSVVVLMSCKKETFNSEPTISYLSINPNPWTYCNTCVNGPLFKFQLTDLEGDFGFADTSISYVYIRNVADTLSPVDSIPFPPMSIDFKKKLNVEVTVDIKSVLPPPHNTRPYTDTVFFEVYVKDFAKHKSNVIRSTDPLYFITP